CRPHKKSTGIQTRILSLTGQWSKPMTPCMILGAHPRFIAILEKSKEVVVMDQADTGARTEISDATKLRDDLDGLVVNMELTLISIIQGVALFFLTDSSRIPLLAGQFAVLPYVIVGLLIIFLFWSRSAIHTFTVIRWPLEFGHNFGYVACTLAEAILFTQMSNVTNWY